MAAELSLQVRLVVPEPGFLKPNKISPPMMVQITTGLFDPKIRKT